MYFSDLYIAYFKHQAVNHPDLLHDDAVGSRVFEVITVEEALGDFRTAVAEKNYIMRLMHYTYNVGDRGLNEVRKYIQGGFIIAHYHSDKAGTVTQLEAMALAEKVVDEIIEKMIADSKAGHPLLYHSLDSKQDITVSPVMYVGDNSYSGWMCLFNIYNWWRDCITHEDAPAWLDDGVTPFELLEE